MKKDALVRARESFDIEAEAITATKNIMDWEAIAAAVDLLVTTPLIGASGCGHSGICCMHFAHSMCCVERPARFIYPSEAMHGAIGFLNKGDVLVLASRGGYTDELMPLMEIALIREIKVITITENIKSLMASKSDIVIPMQVPRESDSFNSQGTSSFVAMTAIFDALQVAIMEETGYKNKQFAQIHPGGAVGKRINCSETIKINEKG